MTEKYNRYVKTATREAGLVFSIRVIAFILGFAMQTLFARLLGADKYGLYSLGLTVANVGVLFAVFGMSSGQIRFLGEYLGKGEIGNAKGVIFSAFQVTGIISIILSVILIIFRRFISIRIFNEERLIDILPWFSIILLLYSFFNLLSGTFQGLKKPSVFILYKEFIERIIRITLFIALYLLGYKLIGVIVSTVISSILILLFLFIKIKKYAPFIFKPEIKPVYERKKLLKYSSNMLFVSFTYFLMGQVNRLILGIYLDSKSVGLYTVSDTVAQLSVFFLMAFNSIFSSMISELYHTGDKETLSKLYSDITRWIITFTLPITIWVLIYSENILEIFGKEFSGARWVLVFLAIGQFVNAAVGSNGLMLSMTKYQRFEMINGVFIASLNLGLNIWLVPKFGIIGSAIGGMAAISTVNIVKSVEVYILLKMIPYNWKYLKPVIAGIGTAITMIFLKNYITNLVGTFIMLAISFVLMLGILALLGLYPEDKEILKTVMKKFFKK
ncbi:oligosaccharide flippase family protein [Thermosipho atlanticus]|uniref:Membrane protein involved in the export of O-antigen and teichoic acid n=1 Tax=Thermosipho atlanticus DSM 15807 TaxID=1123380 RepID=A0A1M5RP32_9BACT|nr:oligosaccharide flippase family protein [Thermosipho atlanticus]SHH27911.1 Membrane protein involved in the export of O-antigen and teichoic acid [Thermosipho atlanticus DSM 15807]